LILCTSSLNNYYIVLRLCVCCVCLWVMLTHNHITHNLIILKKDGEGGAPPSGNYISYQGEGDDEEDGGFGAKRVSDCGDFLFAI
jgi:hypothetical protein